MTFYSTKQQILQNDKLIRVTPSSHLFSLFPFEALFVFLFPGGIGQLCTDVPLWQIFLCCWQMCQNIMKGDIWVKSGNSHRHETNAMGVLLIYTRCHASIGTWGYCTFENYFVNIFTIYIYTLQHFTFTLLNAKGKVTQWRRKSRNRENASQVTYIFKWLPE